MWHEQVAEQLVMDQYDQLKEQTSQENDPSALWNMGFL